jgi:phage I-like protein
MNQASFLAAINAEADVLPDWVELIPAANADGLVKGRDGREWRWDAQAQNAVLAANQERDIDLVIDWEHSTQRRAPEGEEAQAAAWIKKLELRNGALCGMVDWTPRGAAQVKDKAYRFLSPVFDYSEAGNRIVRLVSAALTNRPNLRLPALNSEDAELHDGEKIFRHVPQANYDAQVQRAENAERELVAYGVMAHRKAVNETIDQALKAAKITPATEGFFRATCSDAEGLERFRTYLKAAIPIIVDDCGLSSRRPAQGLSLNNEELEVARLLGQTEAEFLAAKPKRN